MLLSYLIIDCVCLTLSLADTHGIAKHARTYLRDTHTHAHTQKGRKTREKKGGKSRKNQKKKRGGKHRKKEEKEQGKRKRGKRRRKMRGKRGGEEN